MTEFFMGCLGLFNITFNAVWNVVPLRFFMLAMLLAVVVVLVFSLSHAARK